MVVVVVVVKVVVVKLVVVEAAVVVVVVVVVVAVPVKKQFLVRQEVHQYLVSLRKNSLFAFHSFNVVIAESKLRR